MPSELDAGMEVATMRLVITGAAGFVGSVRACDAADQGHHVLALDNLSRGLNRPADSKLGAGAVGSLMFKQHDCKDGLRGAVEEFEAEAPIDAVIHLAAGTGSLDRPLN